jgi:hypothetical protein
MCWLLLENGWHEEVRMNASLSGEDVMAASVSASGYSRAGSR